MNTVSFRDLRIFDKESHGRLNKMKPSKIIVAFEDKYLNCAINDNQGHALDNNNLTRQERVRIIDALDSFRQLFLKNLNH